MTASGRPGAPPDAMLLVHAPVGAASAWAYRGQVAVYVLPYGEWTALVPTTVLSRAEPPYHEGGSMLLGRPVPGRLREAVGVLASGASAFVTVSPRGLDRRRRWAAWQSGTGLHRPGRLRIAPVSLIAQVAHASGQVEALGAVLRDPSGEPRGVVVDILTALGLPGADVMGGSQAAAAVHDAVLVEPAERRVAGFSSTVHDDRSWREEIEGGHDRV